MKGEPIGVAEVTVGSDGGSKYTVNTKFVADPGHGFLINMLSEARAGIVATLTDSKLRADKIVTARGRRESTVEFDWENGVAASTDKRRRSEVSLRGTDKNARRDVLAKAVFVETRWIPGNYAVADLESGVQETSRDEEDIETRLATYRATSVVLPLSSTWKLTLWSTAQLNGLPVKLEMSDGKGRTVSFTLATLGGGA